jgi:hypothetical protein
MTGARSQVRDKKMRFSQTCRLEVREDEPESACDEPNEATKGPSEPGWIIDLRLTMPADARPSRGRVGRRTCRGTRGRDPGPGAGHGRPGEVGRQAESEMAPVSKAIAPAEPDGSISPHFSGPRRTRGRAESPFPDRKTATSGVGEARCPERPSVRAVAGASRSQARPRPSGRRGARRGPRGPRPNGDGR